MFLELFPGSGGLPQHLLGTQGGGRAVAKSFGA